MWRIAAAPVGGVRKRDRGRLCRDCDAPSAYSQGRFTYSERTIPKAGIDSLEFRGVESPDAEIRNAALTDQGDHWRIRWAFPARRAPARYTLRYTARGALDTGDGREVVDWDVVGSKWPVAIRGVDAVIRIPRAFAETEAALSVPAEAEIRRGAEDWRVVLARDRVPPGERFRVRVGFPEAGLAGGGKPAAAETETGWHAWLLAGFRSVLGFALGVALLAMVPDGLARWRRQRAAATETRQPPDLSPEEAAVFLHDEARSAWPAAIYRLAEAGALVLRHSRDTGPFLRRAIYAEARAAPEDADTRFGADVLARCANEPVKLADLGHDLSRTSTAHPYTRAALARKGLLAERGAWSGHAQQPVALLLFFIALYPGLLDKLPLPPELPLNGMVLGAAIGMWWAGKCAYRETGLGLITRRRLEALFARKRNDLLAQARAEPAAALARYLKELSWLRVDPKADSDWLKRFREQVRGTTLGHAVLPAWLVFDDAALPTDAADLVDTMFKDLVLPVANAAPGGPGGGAGGGGAGGGGGGAGGGGGGAG